MRQPDQQLHLTTSTDVGSAPAETVRQEDIVSTMPEVQASTFRERVESGEMDRHEMITHVRSEWEGDIEDIDPQAVIDTCDAMYRFTMDGISRMGRDGAVSQEMADKAVKTLTDAREASRVHQATFNESTRSAAYYDGSNGLLMSKKVLDGPYPGEGSFSFRHPSDARFLKVAGLLGHEVGHAINEGLSNYLNDTYVSRTSLSVARRHLTHHTEQAVTGNHLTDEAIHEERGPEGFAAVSLDETMKVMGYSDAEIAGYIELISHKPHLEGGRGQNQIDFLGNPEGNSFDVRIGRGAPDVQNVAGLLGYALPFSRTQVVKYLAEAEELAAQPLPYIHTSGWGERVAQNQDPEIKEYVQGLLRDRREALWGAKREKLRGVFTKTRVKIGAAAVLAALGIVGGAHSIGSGEGSGNAPSVTHQIDHTP